MSNTISQSPDDGEDPDELRKEDIHTVLSNTRRRIVIECLREHGGAMDARELSERIAAVETGEDPPPRNIRQSAYVSLHQTHLPKLDDLDIVEYDSTSKQVELQEMSDEVAVYMETVPKYGISWSEYYTSLAILGLLTMIATDMGVPLISQLPVGTLGYLFLTLIGISGIYQTYRQGTSIIHRLTD